MAKSCTFATNLRLEFYRHSWEARRNVSNQRTTENLSHIRPYNTIRPDFMGWHWVTVARVPSNSRDLRPCSWMAHWTEQWATQKIIHVASFG